MLHVYSTPAWKHWLFVEGMQEWLCDKCILFDIWGLPVSSPHIRIEGLTAKTVPVAWRKIEPQPNEVVVSVVQKGRPTQISIDPSYLGHHLKATKYSLPDTVGSGKWGNSSS